MQRVEVLLREATPSGYQRVFAEIAQERPDAIVMSAAPELLPYRQLIVELGEKNCLPATARRYIPAAAPSKSYAFDF
jgi:hypothetical protein